MQHPINRRRFGIGIATLATGGAAIATHSQPARAAATVDPDGLNVPDVEKRTDGDDVTAVNLSVDCSYAYDATVTPDALTLELLIGDGADSLEPIATHDATVNGSSDSATVELSGDVTSTWHFSLNDFTPNEGETISQLVWAGLRIVVKHGGSTLAEEQVTDMVRVTANGDVVEASAAIGGAGEVVVETG